eukprot:Sspe_Gene.660::Locus_227_Transcript_1_1_Confidence_1.000_Length_473::g.660::m.660/K03769/ppiC; peptidyl-prolyl cis-trans isomerase C
MAKIALILGLMCLAGFAAAKSAKASHILVPDEATCKDIKERIENGADFAEMAKEHSKCPSGREGGDLGEFQQGQMVPEFDKVIFDPKSEMGKVYGPVKTQFGYHLIKIFKRKGVNGEETAP